MAKTIKIWPFGPQAPIESQKGMEMNFQEKMKTSLSFLIPNTMHNIRKIYRADFRENRGRETNRQKERERDGPEFKGPPDAIAKPLDQKDCKIKTKNFYGMLLVPLNSISKVHLNGCKI